MLYSHYVKFLLRYKKSGKMLKKRGIFSFLIFLSILLGCSQEQRKEKSAGIFVKDDLNVTVNFDNPPKRIVSLAPSLTEMIYKIDYDKFLIGNTLYCNFPDDAKSKEKVGDMLTIDFEKIISLKPDLILISVEGNNKSAYDKLNELGLKTFVSNPRNYEGIKKTYLDLGKIFGKDNAAEQQVSKWERIVNTIKNNSDSAKSKTVMFLISLNPLMLAGKHTFINEYIDFCGFKNIADDVEMNYPVFNREEVLKRNPDYIVFAGSGAMAIDQIANAYPEWKNINAVKNNNIISVDADMYLRPGPRFITALEDFFRKTRDPHLADSLLLRLQMH